MNKFLANGLFGMGAAALVLTNKPSLARKAKYQLMHSVRAHVGQDDRLVYLLAQLSSCSLVESTFFQPQPHHHCISRRMWALSTRHGFRIHIWQNTYDH
jgi:hypothetical protein